jgi:two-component system chemotaxis response regulator CheB
MPKIRVMVVDDSLTVRRHLAEVLAADPDLEVVGEAGDGKTAIEMCERLRPDVMTLDMMLPVMSGLAATEYIMAYCPTPILVVSASTNRGEVFKTYEALSAGAVDVLDKPTGEITDLEWEQRFIATIKMIARIRVITHPRARLGGLSQQRGELRPTTPPWADPGQPTRVVAIGTSTGGPGAVVSILRNLPASYPLPILLVVHLARSFEEPFVSWLDGQSALPVRYARDGDALPEVGQPGLIMSPPDRHLVLDGKRLRLTMDPERHSCRPSVDVLFESLARQMGHSVAACLLTGMGRDGAEGLLAIRRAGGHTIAQDEASSVVFGMPREAIQLGAAERILSLDVIPAALSQLVRPTRQP